MADATTVVVVAATAAAVVSTFAVMGQAFVQRGQHRLEEAQAHLQQADAWSKLGPDWQRCVIAALGPSKSRYWGTYRHEAEEYRRLIERHRDAEIAWLGLLEGDSSASVVDTDKLIEESRRALEPLEVYRESAQRVLTHLAQLSGLVLRRRIAVSVAYDAIGRDLLRLAMHVRPLVSVSYGMGDGCPAPTNMERLYWKYAELDVISERFGWGGSLATSRGTAERILLLQQMLIAHAYRSGDADDDIGFHEAQIPLCDELCLPNRLALCWKAARRSGRRRAMLVVYTIARAGMLSRRRRPYEYMPKIARCLDRVLPRLGSMDSVSHDRLHRNILTLVATVCDVVRGPRLVVRAWRLSGRILDVRRLDDPPEIQELRSREAMTERRLQSFWSNHYDLASRGYADLSSTD